MWWSDTDSTLNVASVKTRLAYIARLLFDNRCLELGYFQDMCNIMPMAVPPMVSLRVDGENLNMF